MMKLVPQVVLFGGSWDRSSPWASLSGPQFRVPVFFITITALNTFNQGALIDLELSATGGTLTTGTYNLFAVIQQLPGA